MCGNQRLAHWLHLAGTARKPHSLLSGLVFSLLADTDAQAIIEGHKSAPVQAFTKVFAHQHHPRQAKPLPFVPQLNSVLWTLLSV